MEFKNFDDYVAHVREIDFLQQEISRIRDILIDPTFHDRYNKAKYAMKEAIGRVDGFIASKHTSDSENILTLLHESEEYADLLNCQKELSESDTLFNKSLVENLRLIDTVNGYEERLRNIVSLEKYSFWDQHVSVYAHEDDTTSAQRT